MVGIGIVCGGIILTGYVSVVRWDELGGRLLSGIVRRKLMENGYREEAF